MSTRQEFAQAGTLSVQEISSYIDHLRQRHGESGDMATQLRKLSELRFQLQNAELRAADNSPALAQAVRDLTQANALISREIASAKQFQQDVETAAAIAGIIQRALSIALA
jgi:hypothetical protein